MSRAPVWGLALAAGLIAAVLLNDPPATQADSASAPSAAAWLELLCPGLYQPGGQQQLAEALVHMAGTPWPHCVLWIGLPGLALALLGLVSARGALAWVGRATLLVAVLFSQREEVATHAPLLALPALALLAGMAFQRLKQGLDERSALVASVVVVLLAAAAILAAIQAGAATDAQALVSWFGAHAPTDPVTSHLWATALRQLLDQAAVSAAALLLGLLVFVRYRGAAGSCLLLLLAWADAAGWLALA